MAKERELPPPLEMACLNALWEMGEGNVEEVRTFVSRSRPLAYTTVLTLLDRLSRRGAVSRRKEGRGFHYQPSIDRDKLRRLALGHLLEHHFNGSLGSLRSFIEPPADGLPQSAGQLPEVELPEDTDPGSPAPPPDEPPSAWLTPNTPSGSET